MKRLLLTLSLVAMLLSVKAQYHNTKVIITGYLANPTGTDVETTATGKNYEYIQLMATEDIDFGKEKYSLVLANNATNTTPYPSAPAQESWATAGARTYKIDITSGTVAKGQFFYIGGNGGKINGSASQDFPVEANWIVARNYGYVVSDEFVGRVNDVAHALSTNPGMPNSGRAYGIAIFNTTQVSASTVPVDVVFFQDAATGTLWTAGLTPAEGYLICNNDVYKTSDNLYFRGDAKNMFYFQHTTSAETQAYFMSLRGVYETGSKTWITSRALTRVLLNNNSMLSALETDGTKLLPVSLTSFTAKTNKAGKVDLAWTTANEDNNSHFEITRSVDGKSFDKIGQIAGNSNSTVMKNYNFTDNNPVIGVNYYQLKQVDRDGQSVLSQVISAKVGLSQSDVSVSASANQSGVTVNYKAFYKGNATFTIYNISGAKIAEVQQAVEPGDNRIIIPAQLNSSVFLLKVQQGSEQVSVKF